MPQFVRDVEEIRERAIRSIPGAGGRTPRKASDEVFAEEEAEVRAGGESGTSRAVHITNPNRKRKKVA